MLNQGFSFVVTNQYTLPTSSVNRNFKNNTDIDVIIYTINNRLTPAERLVLSTCHKLGTKYGDFRARIDTISRMSRVSHETVTRSLKNLFRLNYLRRWNLGGTPLYVVAQEILDVNYEDINGDIKFYLWNEPEINKNSIYIRESVIAFDSVKINEWVSLEEIVRKKEIDVFEGKQNHNQSVTIIPEYIKKIKEIEITHSQQLELIDYDPETIDYARKVIRSKIEKDGPLDSPFPFFLKICKVSLSKKSTSQGSSTMVDKQLSSRNYKPFSQAAYLRKQYKWLEYVNSKTTDETAYNNNIKQLNYLAELIDKLEG